MSQLKVLRKIAPGEFQVEVPPGEEFICDFCSGKPVVMLFAVAPDAVIQMPGVPGVVPDMNDNSNWAACEECAKLVKAEDQKGLRRRSAETYFKNAGMPIPGLGILQIIEREIEPLHAQFFHARQRHRDDAIGKSERVQGTTEGQYGMGGTP